MTNAEITSEVANRICVDKNKVDHPYVIVLMGLQYSGKSYLAEKIKKHNFAHFWATTIKKDYGIENPDMVEVATSVLEEAVRNKYNIVLDYVNHKYEVRKHFQEISERLGAEYRVIFLDTPKDERLRRRKQNVEHGDINGRRIISLEQMKEFEDAFELPHDDEPTTRLKTQTEIDRFIASL